MSGGATVGDASADVGGGAGAAGGGGMAGAGDVAGVGASVGNEPSAGACAAARPDHKLSPEIESARTARCERHAMAKS